MPSRVLVVILLLLGVDCRSAPTADRPLAARVSSPPVALAALPRISVEQIVPPAVARAQLPTVPATTPRIVLRGGGCDLPCTRFLYVLDGQIVGRPDSVTGAAPAAIAALQPAEVVAIEALAPLAARARFGEAGARGALLITTRRAAPPPRQQHRSHRVPADDALQQAGYRIEPLGTPGRFHRSRASSWPESPAAERGRWPAQLQHPDAHAI